MDTDVVKFLVLVGVLIVTLAFAFTPVAVESRIRNIRNDRRRHSFEKVVSLISCFGGGVFLSTCFLHLFPEVKEQLSDGLDKLGVKSNFPLAEFLVIFGCVTVLSIEQIVLKWKESSPDRFGFLGGGHSHGGGGSSYGSIDSSEPSVQYNFPSRRRRQISTDDTYSIHEDPSSHSNLRSVLLVFSLAIHSIFEGLAIGLQPSTDDVLQLLCAVIIHKCIIAFTLSLNLLHSRLNLTTVMVCNLIFSVMAPLGIGLAIIVDDYSHGSGISLVKGTLQGLACGTFLYVTFFEVLPHEMNKERNRIGKLITLILGCACVTGLLLLFPDS